MQLQPWLISSWPSVCWPNVEVLAIVGELHHLGTVVSEDCDDYGRLLGHTIWGTRNEDVGVAWDWTETMNGIFALSDPMGVVSNIEFVDEEGVAIPGASVVQLNRITHSLRWQDEVANATQGQRTLASRASRIKPPTDYHFRASELRSLVATR